MRSALIVAAFYFGLSVASSCSLADDGFSAGFARTDITPQEPLRLSGYGSRDHPSEGVDVPLHARAMAVRYGDGPLHVLVAVDTIGFPEALTARIRERVEQRHDLDRSRFVIACSHSHTTPQIRLNEDQAFAGNLFAVPLTDKERAAAERYAEMITDKIVDAVGKAIDNLAPARIYVGEGTATFARNRRVLENGIWNGFGENPDGPVDHSLPFLKITDAAGDHVRGIVFDYACHCTTFGGEYNRVNPDWAGYASGYLEETNDGAVALCTIGCGADANPERDRSRAFQIAQAQGREIADAIEGLIDGDLTELTEAPRATFGYAGLPIDRPSVDELRESLNNSQPQIRQHAENMLALKERMGRLPETYPMPIQVWRFGDQFAMVFLGGEVVVDYAFRIRKELSEELAAKPGNVASPKTPIWVTAYSNDVFAYVASERMRDEGGYEVDYSMIYYNQPGRWSSGTEDVILRRVHELFDDSVLQGPLSPADALGAFVLPSGFSIDIVASEPLIHDPVNFTVGPDGRLWVVEMGDYPRGEPDEVRKLEAAGPIERSTPWEGPPGGRIRVLTDVDGDGRYDEAVTFLDGLAFPTGVMPWHNAALISDAPDVFYALDTDGDGEADVRDVLYSGFVESNPQHRVNGFAWGLDNWIYLAAGANSGDITCSRTGTVVNVSGRDMRISPDKGLIEPISGRTQYGRSRDDWGNWFGNTNSEPLFHFAIEDRYLRRNPYVPSPQPRVQIPDPPHAPPVYPSSRTLDRFNDLFALDRFTSACSPLIFRDHTLGEDVYGAALICEPVHNLVSRLMLTPDGITFRGSRHPGEQNSEFLSSRDNWFRPTRLMTGPDGALWLSDMYRLVIEHPEWIPEAWQARLDLYAGHDRGRIYRMYRDDSPPVAAPDLSQFSDVDLVAQLNHPNGWRRDTAHMLLVQRGEISPLVTQALADMAAEGSFVLGRIHALSVLEAHGKLASNVVEAALRADDRRLVRHAIRMGESHFQDVSPELEALADNDDVGVRYQLALSLGEIQTPQAGDVLAELLVRDADDPWIRAAVLSSSLGHADRIFARLLRDMPDSEARTELVGSLVATALGDDPESGAAAILSSLTSEGSDSVARWQFAGLTACLDALQRRKLRLRDVFVEADTDTREATLRMIGAARDVAVDSDASLETRIAATSVLGRLEHLSSPEVVVMRALLAPQIHPDLQLAAVRVLGRTADDGVPQILFEGYRSAAPALRAQILSTLLTRQDWTLALLHEIDRGRISTAELDAATRNALLEHNATAVRVRAAELLGSAGNPDRQAVIDSYAAVLDMSGNVQRGAQVFEKRCATCHKLGDVGRDVGAPLAALQNKTSEYLLTAILDPNRAMEAKYAAYSALTGDGRVFSGMIVEETATSLTLAQADGQRQTLLRVDLEQLASGGKSFMPEGLEKDLTTEQVADVIAFIQASAGEGGE